MMLERDCPNCGKTFQFNVFDYTISNNPVCSWKCRSEYRRGERHHRWKGDDARLERSRRRWQLEQDAEGEHTNEEWEQLKEKYHNKCAVCGEERKLTKDHIIPITKGGSNDISNIQPLCKPCNSRKLNHITIAGKDRR